MAQHLGLRIRWIQAALWAGIATASFADIPRDPTQPPAGIDAAGARTGPAAETQIQSITISGRQRYAMINGIIMKPGDVINEGRIVKITENTVIVKSASGLTALKLFPNVDKHVHSHAKSTRPASVHRNQR
ncbi:hypothetical protein CAP31_04475 [Sulfuriferula sp. AH1]|uniref:hypothetical protein n=1 Tax=Sulfuriferula sp. AH1 TaxID=1985873 RepID=UPI000B3BAC2B|nr:hypothetical protein [Sulfuriferula sp. AH1]ARU31009.1 hypothetical protein CAP31_04475 [Sulfuriferula sp. AH1]